MLDKRELLLGGSWQSVDATVAVHAAHDSSVIGRSAVASRADVDAAVRHARAAIDQGPWPRMSVPDRIAVLERFGSLYSERAEELAQLITMEMGAPISFSRSLQVPGATHTLRTQIDLAGDFPFEETRRGTTGDVLVRHEPVGVVAAVAPWNYPQFIIMAKLAPALLAGNAVIIKPALETALDAQLLAEVLHLAGFPEGVVSVLPCGNDVAEHLALHPGVDKVAFTGSTPVGRHLAAQCGRQLKRISLELGGKSAAIVLDDAPPALVAAGAHEVALRNNGQACVAQSRILIPRNRAAEYTEAVLEHVASLQVGDPADEQTDIGPLVSRRQRDKVLDLVGSARSQGATVHPTAVLDDGLRNGWYVAPTVISDVTNDMTIAREEVFGPVITLIEYQYQDQAVAIANDSDYGLAGSVWTADRERALDVARGVRTGTFGINRYAIDLLAPFGGVKSSGLGRELGREGLAAFTEPKSVVG